MKKQILTKSLLRSRIKTKSSKKQILSLLLIFGAMKVFAQFVFLTDDYSNLYKYYYDSCRIEKYCDSLVNVFKGDVNEIALYSSKSKSYFIGIPDASAIYQNIDTSSCTVQPIVKYKYQNRLINCLEFDEDGILWGIGLTVLKYDPSTGLFEERNRYTGWNRTNYPRNSSMFRYQGQFYWVNGFESFFKLDTNDMRNSQFQFICPVCDSFNTIIRMVFTLREDCNSERVICLVQDKGQYEVNMQTGVFTYLCPVDPFIQNSISIQGLAVPWIKPAHYCDVLIDLDINNNSGNTQNGYFDTLSCFSQLKQRITDFDVNVFSDFGLMDSINIKILNPKNGSSERLDFAENHNILKVMNNQSFTLIPDLFATNDSFALALKEIIYENSDCEIVAGTRLIQFVAYKNNLSDTAISTLTFLHQQAFAGRDTIIELCELSPPISLFQTLGLCYHTGGIWNRQTQVPLIFNPKVDIVGNYQYIVGDTICGFDTATITFRVLKQPNLIVENNISLCFGQIYKISLPRGNYLWQDGSIDSIYTIRQGGIYWVETINGICNVRDSIEVKYNTSPTIEKINLICPNDSIVYKNKIYRSGEIIHDTISSLTTCDTIVEIRIKEFAISKISFNSDTIICKDEIVNLSATSNFQSYKWSTGEDKSSIQVRSGTYTLTVTDVNGCKVNSSITIKESPPIQYSARPINPICPEDLGSIEIKNLQGGTAPFEYYLNGKKVSLSALDNLNSGLYVFKAIDSENCEVSDTIRILDAATFDVVFDDHIELEEGTSHSLTFPIQNPKIASIQVSPNSDVVIQNGTELKFSPKEDITYILTFTDERGCELIKTITFTIKRNEGFYPPTIFSPNGDNINDIWQPTYGNVYTLVSASIYDRWGEQVYYSNDPSTGWNGNHKTQPCNPGVYVYLIELRHRDGSVKKFSGDLGLIR